MSIGLALWTCIIEMNALLLISSLPTINAGRAIRNKQVVSCLILQTWISGWFKWDEYRQCQEIFVWNKKVRRTSCKTTSLRSSRQSTKTFPRQHLLRKGQYSRPSHSNADDDDGIHHYEENWGKSGKIEVNLLISDPPTIFWVMVRVWDR